MEGQCPIWSTDQLRKHNGGGKASSSIIPYSCCKTKTKLFCEDMHSEVAIWTRCENILIHTCLIQCNNFFCSSNSSFINLVSYYMNKNQYILFLFKQPIMLNNLNRYIYIFINIFLINESSFEETEKYLKCASSNIYVLSHLLVSTVNQP